MTILVNNMDLSELIENISWSGDDKQVARKLEFSIVKNIQDSNFPNVTINEGDEVLFQGDTGTVLFGGIIFDIDRTASSKLVKYLAYDLLFYVNGSELTKDYNATPEAITMDVCATLQITPGVIAATELVVANPCIKKTGYQVIQSSYTAAARQNGKKYMLMMTEVNKLSVIEKGMDSGVILTGEDNLAEANYKVSLQNLVNKILIADKNGMIINTVEDIESQEKYGVIQKIISQEEGEDANAEAKSMLRGREATASVSGVLDDVRAIAGYAVLIQEAETGLMGCFFITSDTHKYANGEAVMDLILEFQNLMDEHEIDKPDKT